MFRLDENYTSETTVRLKRKQNKNRVTQYNLRFAGAGS